MKILFAGIIFFLIPLACFSQTKETFSVYFGFNSYELTPASRKQLDSFLLVEKGNLPKLFIDLDGYCDNIGSDKYNYLLSLNRIFVVRGYLVIKEFDKDRFVKIKGHGKKEPLNENATEEERQLNRRVDIHFREIIQTNAPGVLALKEMLADSTLKAGTNIVLRNINFVGGMHLFLQESEPMLKELLDAMRTYPQLIIRVEGHICCVSGPGDGPDNGTGLPNLSEARAQAVQDYLLKNGIAANRVSFKGLGHSAPIYPYPEITEEEKIANRRVEIKIIRK